MIRQFFVGALFAAGLALTACGQGDTPNIPEITAPTELPSVTMPTLPSGLAGMGLDAGLTQAGYIATKIDATTTEYNNPENDITIVVKDGKPTGVKYRNQLLQNCNPSTQSVLNGALTGMVGGTEEQVAEKFCGLG